MPNDEESNPEDRVLERGNADNLKSRALRGGATVLVAQCAKFTVQFGGIAILSRLLAPADIGVVAMVTAFTGLAAVLKDAGLSQATVQRAHITQAQINTLFWFNAGAGLLIFGVLCGLAPLITWFYGDSRLTSITIASSLQFVFAGLSVQHLALLNRDMQFRKLAIIDVGSLVGGFLVGIVMAAAGYGYWALVAMPLVTSLIGAIAAWIFSSWRPGRPRIHHAVGSMMRMGGNLAGFNIVNYFARNLDNSLIGWRWGAGSLGLYSRSYSLFTLPLSQINTPLAQVAISGLSRIQNDPARFASYYTKAATLTVSLTTPLALFTIVAAPEIIELVLGRQWLQCVPIFRWLGVSGILQPLCNSTGWIYISTGRTDRMFRWGILGSIGYCMSFFIGLPFGALGVAKAYTCAVMVLFWPCIAFAVHGTSIQARHLFLGVLPAIISAVAAASACAFFKTTMFAKFNNIASISSTGAVLLVAYLALLLGVFRQRHIYADCLALLFRKA